jgi:hypothetical protein
MTLPRRVYYQASEWTKSGNNEWSILFYNAYKIFEHEVLNMGVVAACRVGFCTNLENFRKVESVTSTRNSSRFDPNS